jgi:mono/diheme cytochrome c family protein
MSTPRAAVAVAFAFAASAHADDLGRDLPHTPLGKPLTAASVPTLWPDGRGLPAGQGGVAAGERLYAERCQSCHGELGTGGSGGHLAGRSALAGPHPDRTVGNYWPYATTVFDYIRRAMPPQAPWSLTADETYALTAYVLHLGGVLPADAVLDARSLPAVRMPNREGFVPSPEARDAGAR